MNCWKDANITALCSVCACVQSAHEPCYVFSEAMSETILYFMQKLMSHIGYGDLWMRTGNLCKYLINNNNVFQGNFAKVSLCGVSRLWLGCRCVLAYPKWRQVLSKVPERDLLICEFRRIFPRTILSHPEKPLVIVFGSGRLRFPEKLFCL